MAILHDAPVFTVTRSENEIQHVVLNAFGRRNGIRSCFYVEYSNAIKNRETLLRKKGNV